MRRRALVLAAAAIALAANSAVLIHAARNRAGAPRAAIELTERELRLVAWGEERTWASLRLDWNRDLSFAQKEPGWFDRAKLASLGFDCRFAEDEPRAQGHYGWLPPRILWIVFEYDGEAARAWLEKRRLELDATLRRSGDPSGATEEGRRAREAFVREVASRSRLFAIDAGTDPDALRRLHPDQGRFLLAQAIVFADWHRPWDPVTRTLGAPFIRGSIETLLVGELQVPRDRRAFLDELATRDRREGDSEAPASGPPPPGAGPSRGGGPRYRVALRYGNRNEPWVTEVSPLP